MISVVAAVIRREDGTILLAQRGPDGHHPLLWEFPGGKVERGETESGALVREIKEELAMEVVVGGLFHVVDYHYPHISIRLVAYDCRVIGGTPTAIHCHDFRWVDPSELSRYPMPEADVPIARKLVESTCGNVS